MIFFLVVCLAVLLCLAPLTFYLFWLTSLTRRNTPSVLAGAWDFTALLLGLSGFLLFGGTLLLTLVQSNVRFWTRGNFEAMRMAWDQERTSWTLVALGYVVLLIGGITVSLLARRRTLVVYNIEPDRLEATLLEIFEHLGRPLTRKGEQWSSGVPLFELDRFLAGKTVTVRWLSDDRLLFQEVERHLRDSLRTVLTPENPATRWLSTFAMSCVLLIVFCVVFFIGSVFFR